MSETRTASVKTKSRRRADNFFTMNSMCEHSSSADGHRLKRLGPKTINTRNQEESFFVLVFSPRVSTALFRGVCFDNSAGKFGEKRDAKCDDRVDDCAVIYLNFSVV